MDRERDVQYHAISGMWIIVETDTSTKQQRFSKGGWYNSTDAEAAMYDDFEWEDWFPRG
jgi:hypothetical protein